MKLVSKFKWISVSTPPTRWGNVLVTDGYRVEIGGYLPKARCWELKPWMGAITYWMPLPEPPSNLKGT